MRNSLYLPQSNYAKIHLQDFPSIGRNVLKFFCVLLYAEFLCNLYKKFQVASTYDIQMYHTKFEDSAVIYF